MKLFPRKSFALPITLGAAVAAAIVIAACGGTSSNETGTGSGGDAGADGSDEASVDQDGSAGDGALVSVCTSGKKWTSGTVGSALMQPGNACITCHTSEHGPTFTVGGTVYPTEREPSLCDGKTGVQVIITDAKNQTFTITSNAAGNFACGDVARDGFPACAGFTFPFTAKVMSNGKINAMIDPQMTGDCNSCHTETGMNNAPGRIMGP